MRHDVGNALHADDRAPVLCVHLRSRVFGAQVSRAIVAAEALCQWAYMQQASQRNLQILRSIFLDFVLPTPDGLPRSARQCKIRLVKQAATTSPMALGAAKIVLLAGALARQRVATPTWAVACVDDERSAILTSITAHTIGSASAYSPADDAAANAATRLTPSQAEWRSIVARHRHIAQLKQPASAHTPTKKPIHLCPVRESAHTPRSAQNFEC